MRREACPSCGSNCYKKNGHVHNGKQNYRCKACGRQFVADPTAKTVTEDTRELIKKALLERNSLRGIGRIFDVSLTWLLTFITDLYDGLSADSGVNLHLWAVRTEYPCTPWRPKSMRCGAWLARKPTSSG